jgi:hypothetical protein
LEASFRAITIADTRDHIKDHTYTLHPSNDGIKICINDDIYRLHKGEDDAEGAASHTDTSRKNGVQYIPVNKKILSELH